MSGSLAYTGLHTTPGPAARKPSAAALALYTLNATIQLENQEAFMKSQVVCPVPVLLGARSLVAAVLVMD